jgi:hypothetical protein
MSIPRYVALSDDDDEWVVWDRWESEVAVTPEDDCLDPERWAMDKADELSRRTGWTRV